MFEKVHCVSDAVETWSWSALTESRIEAAVIVLAQVGLFY